MGTAIKRQIIVQWRDWVIAAMIILGASIFGVILFAVIAAFDKETVSYFPLGTTMGGVTALMFAFLMVMTQLSLCFNTEVSMGCTRKHFFVSYYITCFTAVMLSAALVILVNVIERTVYHRIYVHLTEETDFLPYLIRWSVPVAVVIPMLGGFFGALMMKFGKVAFWILWAMWMFLCLGFPNIHDAMTEAPDSVLGKIGNFASGLFAGVSTVSWLVLGAAVCLAAFAGTWIILRKQQVTV